MQLETKHFGTIEVDDKEIIEFPYGIPSFENVNKYTIVKGESEESPFRWLQSVDSPDLAFAIIDPFTVKNDYDIDIKEEYVNALGIQKAEDVLVYAIVVVPEDISKISMNLKAPVIINTNGNKGMQVILDTDKYSVRHYILDELRRQEVNGNACSDKEEGSVDCNK